MKAPRKKLTIRLQKKLYDEVRSTCPAPECKTAPGVSTLEIHHRDGNRENNAEENLIALCPTCHTKATKGLISEADVDLWKKMLVRRLHPRLGPESAADLVKPVRRPRSKTVTFKAEGNSGPVYQGEKITVTSPGPVKVVRGPAPDSIAAHAAERSYIDYLRKAYIECRQLEARYDPSRKRHYNELKNAFAKAVGCEPLDEPIGSFLVLWPRARAAVAATVGARKYRVGYEPHDWDEHRRRSSA